MMKRKEILSKTILLLSLAAFFAGLSPVAVGAEQDRAAEVKQYIEDIKQGFVRRLYADAKRLGGNNQKHGVAIGSLHSIKEVWCAFIDGFIPYPFGDPLAEYGYCDYESGGILNPVGWGLGGLCTAAMVTQAMTGPFSENKAALIRYCYHYDVITFPTFVWLYQQLKQLKQRIMQPAE